ncbi:MAG: 23S rRNA (pseudouridine(1915)-N(3))-methyltransferase RlmH [Candidatus Aminicenantes bacterium]|nr:23S rRNA (pseudouridine(1915)-N(3))-methyltransferase RlmH [Candidatus Aminicenantes bacterium]
MNLIWPGKTRNKWIRGLEEEYLNKIRRMGHCSIVLTRETKGLTEKEKDRILSTEAEGLLKHLDKGYVVCLSDKGRSMASAGFAEFVNQLQVGTYSCISFVVGGHLGLEDRVMQRSNICLSLSKMTFSHEMTRVMLLEQLYRSFSLILGRKYAK